MSEVDDYADELEEVLGEITKGIDKIRTLNGSAKLDQVELLNNRIARAKQIFLSLKIEVRELPKEAQRAWEGKCTDYNERINKLMQELDWAKRDELTGGAGRIDTMNPDNLTAGQLLKAGVETQKESLDATDRIKKKIDQTKEVGTKTMEELASQREQIESASGQMDTLLDNLKQASNQLRAFARKMVTDKIIMGIICLIIIGIIFCIVWSATHSTNLNSIDSFL